MRVKVVKNKVAAPFREAEFDIIFNEGVSLNGEIVDLGAEKGIIDKAGAWFSFRGERMGQGREGAKQFLRDNPEIAAQIRSLVMDSYVVGNADASTEADASEDVLVDDAISLDKPSKGRRKAAVNE